MLLFFLITAYLAAGAIVAMAFAAFGAQRIVSGAQVSVGARILLIPGALLLWPLVLKRWIAAQGQGHDG